MVIIARSLQLKKPLNSHRILRLNKPGNLGTSTNNRGQISILKNILKWIWNFSISFLILGTVGFFMLSHVARVSLFQDMNERRENLCFEFFLDKIDYAVLKYLIILIKFIVISSKLSSEFLIYFLIKKIRLYIELKF
jgi:hypothetical protein